MKQLKTASAGEMAGPKSPLDLWRLLSKGGKSRRVATPQMPAVDSLLAVFRQALTYTFILGREVASIHFDRGKKEIFFKGHNIRNLTLDEGQVAALLGLKEVIQADPRGRGFLKDYDATLGGILADKLREGDEHPKTPSE